MSSTIKRVIAVTSCKGGVGKSTVSMGLARALAARGHRVGLFDADMHGPSLPSQLPAGVSARGVAPAADGWSVAPLVHDGVACMSYGWIGRLAGAADDEDLDTRGAGTAGELAIQLLHTTAWGDLDYLVLDTPPGTGEVPRALAARGQLGGAVVVTTPSALAIADVVRGAALLAKFGVPVLGVVENMASFRCGGCGETHHPFGTTGLDAVLDAVGGDAPAFTLPIVAAGGDAAPLAPALDALVDALAAAPRQKPAAVFPRLAWHERPYWPDKMYFAAREKEKMLRKDVDFKITPPKLFQR